MRKHHLKIWPEYWHAVRDGIKTAEIRRNDRDYRVGDVLALEMWDWETETYILDDNCQRQRVEKEVSHVIHGGTGFGLEAGYCMLSFKAEVRK